MEEINVVRKPYRRGLLQAAVAYPSLYVAAVKSLSVQMLYFLLNSFDEVAAERFVLSRPRGEEPPARSIEGGRALEDFWLILFSVHYEPDYVNIVRLLRAGGVHPLARSREQVVVVGGPPVIANPEPLSEIADVLVAGEIETTVPKLVEAAIEHAGDKRALLDSLSPKEGFYVPSRGDEEVAYSYPRELPAEYHPTAQVQPRGDGWRRTTMVEVSRGCSRGCFFCMEGHIFAPKRDRPREHVLRIAREGSVLNGSRHLTLISLSLLDHPEADALVAELHEEGYEFSLPSLRLDALTPERLELLARSGQRTLVLAPETADFKLSLAIGKPLLKDRLLEVAREARKVGFRSLKLYFMVGLPGEEVRDVEKVAELVREVSAASGFRGPAELKVSVSVFVPKPQTPMQYFGMEDPARVKGKLRLLKERVGGVAEVRPYKPAWAYVQGVLARGGRELTGLLIEWALQGGGLGGWRAAARRVGIDVERYLRPIDPAEEVPWSRVRLWYPGEALARGYELCLLHLRGRQSLPLKGRG